MGLREIIATLLPFTGITLKEPVVVGACSTPVNPLLVHSVIALVGSLFFAVVIYFLSAILRDTRERGFAIGELQEVVATVIIFLIAYALMVIPCAPYGDPFTGHTLNAYQRAFYLLQSVDFVLRVLTIYLQVPYFIVSLLNFSVTAFGTSVTSFQGIFMILKPFFTQNVTLLSLALAVVDLLIYTYDLFTAGMLFYLLPIGLFLRSFYLTRKVGGAIIGMAITLGIIYPFVLSFFYPFELALRPPGISTHTAQFLSVDVNQLEASLDIGAGSSVPVGNNTTAGDVYEEVDQYLYQQREEKRSAVLDLFGSMGTNALVGAGLTAIAMKIAAALKFSKPLQVFLGGLAMLAGLSVGLSLAVYTLAYGFIFAFLFPVLVTIIVSTAGRFISALLGQEVDLGNLTRLI